MQIKRAFVIFSGALFRNSFRAEESGVEEIFFSFRALFCNSFRAEAEAESTLTGDSTVEEIESTECDCGPNNYSDKW